MNKISSVTRRNIFDMITMNKIQWNGRLQEPEFLLRIFDLSKLPSHDYRFDNALKDIYQHRIYNNDWDELWIFTDGRLNLLNCDDALFLKFLCEMIHPIVRIKKKEINKLLNLFNDNLKNDNFEIIESEKISGKTIFKAREISLNNSIVSKINEEIVSALNSEYISKKINRMEKSLESDPDLSIGTAKELIETICKTILDQRDKKPDKTWDIPKLVKETAKELKLTPKNIPEQAKAFETVKIILDSLAKVINGINDLRNSYGTGHGKDAKFKGLSKRHAKLATGAASTLAIFLLETHSLR